jgi:septum formation protein
MATSSVVLASRSPRRIDILNQMGVDHVVMPADIDESPLPNEDPVSYVRRLALEKARAVRARVEPSSTVLAADTTVDVGGQILGQPVDEADSRRMLRLLSGRTHQVHTGVAVVSAEGESAVVVTSYVTFIEVTDTLLDWYLGTGESVGKAGSYAIQGHGASLVLATEGSMSNIIGLPKAETARLLGIDPAGVRAN